MLKILTLIDEYTLECMTLRVSRRLVSYEVIERLADVMQQRAIPQHLGSNNGPEFIAQELRRWLGAVGSAPL